MQQTSTVKLPVFFLKFYKRALEVRAKGKCTYFCRVYLRVFSVKLSLNVIEYRGSKENCQLINILPVISKVFEGSIFGPTLFKIFLSDLLLIVKDTTFSNYAEDNAIYKACDNVCDVIIYLKQYFKAFSKWLSDYRIKENTNNFHLIMSSDDFS